MSIPAYVLFEVYELHCRNIRWSPVSYDEFVKSLQGRGFRLSYYHEGPGTPVMEIIRGLSLNPAGRRLLAHTRAGRAVQAIGDVLPQPRVQRGRARR